jgi:hypothetical protein
MKPFFSFKTKLSQELSLLPEAVFLEALEPEIYSLDPNKVRAGRRRAAHKGRQDHSTHGRRRLQGYLPQLDEFFFTTDEKKILENCSCSVPNFMND